MSIIPAEWRKVRLGDICTLNYGKALPETDRQGGTTPVYGSNGIVGYHNSAITSGRTIIIGRKGSFGEINFSEHPCWPIDTAYFVDEASTKQDIRWLAYRLNALGLNQMNKAAAVPGLNREDAYRQELLLPHVPEQRRIAAILDQADALRAKRREALALLDSLTQSIFIEMFGDPVLNPKEFKTARISEHVKSASTWNPVSKPDEIITYIDISAIDQDRKIVSSPRSILGSDAPSRARQIVHYGDILVSTVRPIVSLIIIPT